VAQEAVTVPAGTFRAWKVEVSSATDDTDLLVLWVDQASRRVLKSVQSGPVLAGGTLTLELQS
jgi:hypothetical protein